MRVSSLRSRKNREFRPNERPVSSWITALYRRYRSSSRSGPAGRRVIQKRAVSPRIAVSSPGEGDETATCLAAKAQAPISLDGAARGALDRVKGQAASTDYKESITNVTVVGLPGRKIQCSFTNGGDKLFLVGVIFTDRTRMWQVIWTGEVSPLNTSLASHVIASVKRSASRAGTG